MRLMSTCVRTFSTRGPFQVGPRCGAMADVESAEIGVTRLVGPVTRFFVTPDAKPGATVL